MVRKILVAAVFLAAFTANSDSKFGHKGKASGRVVKLGDTTRDLVIKQWLELEPHQIAAKFGKKFDLTDVNEVGLRVWRPSQSELYDLLDWRLCLLEKKMFHKGRQVLYFRAKFSKPKGKNVKFTAWDAFYLLGPKVQNKCICKGPDARFPWCPVNGHLVSP